MIIVHLDTFCLASRVSQWVGSTEEENKWQIVTCYHVTFLPHFRVEHWHIGGQPTSSIKKVQRVHRVECSSKGGSFIHECYHSSPHNYHHYNNSHKPCQWDNQDSSEYLKWYHQEWQGWKLWSAFHFSKSWPTHRFPSIFQWIGEVKDDIWKVPSVSAASSTENLSHSFCITGHLSAVPFFNIYLSWLLELPKMLFEFFLLSLKVYSKNVLPCTNFSVKFGRQSIGFSYMFFG